MHRLSPSLVTVIACILSTAAGAAAQAGDDASKVTRPPGPTSKAPPVLEAHPIHGNRIRVDGNLDEPIWRDASTAAGFTQFQPDEGAPASHRTEAKVLYGPEALYVGIQAYDPSPDSIQGQLTRRDQESYSDWVGVILDSYYDRRTAFQFLVNPVGVKRDVYLYDDTEEDRSWDAVWDVSTRVTEEGWTAEFRIPFSQLRFGESALQTWGVNFVREVARRRETTLWAPILPSESGVVSRFGDLTGLRDLRRPSRLELQPYLLTRVRRAPGNPSNPFYEETDLFGSLGAGVKYGITGDLTVDVTLNPDFGQVEADPSSLNLSAFEVFFEEKRPFFIEGANIFDFRIGLGDGGDDSKQSLFYSRRVGRQPQGRANPQGGYADVPEGTTILGAWKLSGKTASGWTIGALQAVTAEERADVVTGFGDRVDKVVEPLTNYGVIRLQKDFRNGWSALGVVGTATNRDGAMADQLRLRRGAYTGGVDFRHRFGGSGEYHLDGYFVGSHIRGSTASIAQAQLSPVRYYQRPDADHVELNIARSTLSGWSTTVNFSKVGDGSWRYGNAFQARSPGFEPNDAGFMSRADYLTVGPWIGYSRNRPGKHLRSWRANLDSWTQYSFGGEREALGALVSGSGRFNNYWSAWIGGGADFQSLMPASLRGGPSLMSDDRIFGWFGGRTDGRKPISFRWENSAGMTPASDSWRFYTSLRTSIRPSSSSSLWLGPFLSRDNNATQWVTRLVDGGRTEYLFGRIDQTTVGLTVYANFTFTPALSIQYYAQPYLSSGHYSEFKRVADPRSKVYGERFQAVGASRLPNGSYRTDASGNGADEFFRDPDFDFMQFRSNAVLRWEYRPGSIVYLVWTQSRRNFGGEGSFRLGRHLDALFDRDPDNIFMVKVSYWLTP